MTEKYIVSAEDTETVINYSRYDIGEWPELYTTDKVVMKRYEKFTKAHPEVSRLVKEDLYSMTFAVHPKCVGLYPRAPRNRQYTEEERQAAAERLRSARKTPA